MKKVFYLIVILLLFNINITVKASTSSVDFIRQYISVLDNSTSVDQGVKDCVEVHKDDKSCGSVYFIPKELPFFTKLIVDLVKIFTPLVLIIKGLIDIFKAVTGNNEQEIEKARAKFFKRLIPAVTVFLTILIVQFVFGIVTTDNENNTFLACTNCFLNNSCPQTSEDKINNYCQDFKKQKPGEDDGGGGGTTPVIIANETREKIANFANDSINSIGSNFKYLTPLEYENTDCITKFYEGNKCITSKKEKCDGNNCTYYGADSNGYVSYVYHKSVGFDATQGSESEKYKFFVLDEANQEWKRTTSGQKYFAEGIPYSNDKAEKGDVVARYCTPPAGCSSYGSIASVGVYYGTTDNYIVHAYMSGSGKSYITKFSPTGFSEERLTSSCYYKNCTLTLFKLTSDGSGGGQGGDGGSTGTESLPQICIDKKKNCGSVKSNNSYVKCFVEKGSDYRDTVSESNKCRTDTIYQGKKYNLTDQQKRKLAGMILGEYGSDEAGMKAVASQMANNYEKWRYYYKSCATTRTLYEYVIIPSGDNCHHYATADKPESTNATALKVVEDVLVNGNRTLPLYVDEFDMFPNDINTFGEVRKKSSQYVQGVTEVNGCYGGKGIFWCMAQNPGDANLH